MNEMRAEVWKILTEVHGCKRDGEDCTHKKCNRYFTCEALITALLPQATEEVKECVLCHGLGKINDGMSTTSDVYRTCPQCLGNSVSPVHQSVVKEKNKPGLLQQKYVIRVKELEAALKAEKFMVIATKTTLNESIEQATRYKKALAEIENNHFECDAGEACKAHSIAKKALEGGCMTEKLDYGNGACIKIPDVMTIADKVNEIISFLNSKSECQPDCQCDVARMNKLKKVEKCEHDWEYSSPPHRDQRCKKCKEHRIEPECGDSLMRIPLTLQDMFDLYDQKKMPHEFMENGIN